MRILLIAFISLMPLLSSAQSWSSSPWDFSVGLIYQDSLSVGGEGGPETATPDTSSLRVDSEIGLGFNVSYSFSEYLSVGLDVDWIEPDYELVLVSDAPGNPDVRVDHELTQWNWRLKGTWNFTEGPLVPFVDFGFGWTNVDSNVANGPPITGCWWHHSVGSWGQVLSAAYP